MREPAVLRVGSNKRILRWLALLFVPLFMADAMAEPLPSPLTLEFALSLADEAHPDRLSVDASLAQAEARRQQADATDDFNLSLSAELRAIEPSDIAYYQTRNDSLARINLSKQLYDFGRTAHAREAAQAGLDSQRWQLVEVRQQRRLDVMERYFAVLLADLEFARDNEALSIDYIRFDRARAKQELGKVSDIDLLELETAYQQSRRKLSLSRNRQRITRSQLAIVLNRPGDLPANLVAPVFEPAGIAQEVEPLIDRALQENPRLKALRAELQAAEKQLRAHEAEGNPVIRAELEAAAYKRELGGRDPLTAALVFEWPLYQGSRIDARVAEQRATVLQKQAELSSYEMALRQQLLDDWMALQELNVEREGLQVKGDYQDLYLDRSRTLYDLDMASDLGDSMTQIAAVQYERARNLYQIQLTQARLDALTGGLLEPAEASRETQ
ncbi:MAG: TolC family protein [Candidatus Thiodiazotropha sp.]